MSLSPWLRSPFTDITGGLISHQWYGRCDDFELKLMECLEAYGLERGRQKCDILIKDFRECTNRHKQEDRVNAMRLERNRQYYAGERSKDNLYDPAPKADSY